MAGYIKGAEGMPAEADWRKFAGEHNTMVELKSVAFVQAVCVFRRHQPKKQIVANGKLSWEEDSYSGVFDMDRLLTLVRRVRNNLFHGGKFQSGLEADLARNNALLSAGIEILSSCLDASSTLNDCFTEPLP